MIIFCSFEQLHTVIQYAAKYGFKHYIPLVFCKPTSPQVLKANMRICGATEYALILYRDKLPKFRNDGHMVKNYFMIPSGTKYPKVHPTQKNEEMLKRLISLFTDPGDVVIDPCAGSGSTLRAAYELGRNSYGFECGKHLYQDAISKVLRFKDFENYKKIETVRLF